MILNTMEVFNPSTNTWSTPKTTGNFTPRTALTSAVVNGKIYVMGGLSAIVNSELTPSWALNRLEIFDPSTNSWSSPITKGECIARKGMTSAVLNGKIYVLGGMVGGIILNTMEVFDPATNSWNTPSLVGACTPRTGPTCAVVNGTIFAMGGRNIAGYINAVESIDLEPIPIAIKQYSKETSGAP